MVAWYWIIVTFIIAFIVGFNVFWAMMSRLLPE